MHLAVALLPIAVYFRLVQATGSFSPVKVVGASPPGPGKPVAVSSPNTLPVPLA